ncbi:MAG: site-specific integrase [bacterium]|nr:site-specific integrase [bacterium]
MSRREGQVVKRGEGKFLIRWSVGADSATGKYRHKSRTIHGTKREAERALRQILRSRDTGEYVDPSKETLAAYLERWLMTVSMRLSPRTHADYCWLLNAYVVPRLGDLVLEQIRRSDVQAFINELSAQRLRPAGRRKAKEQITTGTLSPRTVRLAHAILGSALRDAVRDDLLHRNPAELISLPRQQRREMYALSVEQVASLRSKLEGDPYAAFFDFLIGTGCRPGEALALRWADLDLDSANATIRRSLSRGSDGKPTFKEPKTAGSRRAVPLPKSLAAALRDHRRVQSERALKLGAAYDRAADLAFANAAGRPLEVRNLVNRHFKPALERAELPKIVRLYDLRHTHATMLAAAGVNPKVVAERLGHSTTRQTLDTYSHVMPGMQEEATRQIEKTLFG